MNLLDLLFPYAEPLSDAESKAQKEGLANDIAAIESAKFKNDPARALAEAQRVADAETARVRTAETKATTYLAVLAALVPLIIAFQAATWEERAGPAPTWLKLLVLSVATIYLAAAGYHAFRTLQVSGFERVVEGEIAAAWSTRQPLRRLTRSTLLASRRSRNAVNRKVTCIKVTHEHLIRAFAAFVLLLALDPIFYAVDWTIGHVDGSVKDTPTAAATIAAEATGEVSGESREALPEDDRPVVGPSDTSSTGTPEAPLAQPGLDAGGPPRGVRKD